jgi:hypothetical protein
VESGGAVGFYVRLVLAENVEVVALAGLLLLVQEADVVLRVASLFGAEQQIGFARALRVGDHNVAGDGSIHLLGSFAKKYGSYRRPQGINSVTRIERYQG